MFKALLYNKKVKHYFILFVLAIFPARIIEFLTSSFIPFYYESEAVYRFYKWALIIALMILFEFLYKKIKAVWAEKKEYKLEKEKEKEKYKDPWEL